MFTFREILNLAKEFGRSLPGKHLIPRYFNIDRYERQKYGLISMCILSFDILNSLHETIKFTHEMSYSQIDILDTTVKFGHNRGLITTLYNKPTDTHLYLEHTSAHPNSILTKGPYGQYLRLRRICTLDIDFESNAKKFAGYYLKRGYPFSSSKNIIEQGNTIRMSF